MFFIFLILIFIVDFWFLIQYVLYLKIRSFEQKWISNKGQQIIVVGDWINKDNNNAYKHFKNSRNVLNNIDKSINKSRIISIILRRIEAGWEKIILILAYSIEPRPLNIINISKLKYTCCPSELLDEWIIIINIILFYIYP